MAKGLTINAQNQKENADITATIHGHMIHVVGVARSGVNNY